MAHQSIFPFRRVSVDHMVRGTSRVWWQLDPLFQEPGRRTFQLQVGKTGINEATDWKNVGDPVVDSYVAVDPAWRLSGYDLLTHYRVVLTTPTATYTSQPANCWGELNERDWVLAREIIRKEQLRHKFVSVPGYLIKIMRSGKACPRCRDSLTKEVTDSYCPICGGTGFEVGYHPPLPMQCWDLSPQIIQEHTDSEMRGTTRQNAVVTARVIGFPALNRYDVWVNSASDERWVVDTIQVVAAMRGVPLVYQVQLHLLPFSDNTYAIEVGGESATRDPNPAPELGCGLVSVNHNYTGDDQYSYANDAACPIIGADVYVFAKDVYDVNGTQTNRGLAVAKTNTMANGRWAYSVNLDPGEYVVLYEKPGQYGPDVAPLIVAEPVTAPAPVVAAPPVKSQPKSKPPKDGTNSFWNI